MNRLIGLIGVLWIFAFGGAAAAQQAAGLDTSPIVEMVQGTPDAPVTVIEYASYTCPHCATFHAGAYRRLKADYIDTGKVRLIYREVYFDRYGLWASMIARCGGAEKFFEITDRIYAGQADWTRAGDDAAVAAALREIGRAAGIAAAPLEACMQDAEKLRALVAWYQKNAQADGIDATPSFVINGVKVPNQSYASFSALIDAELGQ